MIIHSDCHALLKKSWSTTTSKHYLANHKPLTYRTQPPNQPTLYRWINRQMWQNRWYTEQGEEVPRDATCFLGPGHHPPPARSDGNLRSVITPKNPHPENVANFDTHLWRWFFARWRAIFLEGNQEASGRTLPWHMGYFKDPKKCKDHRTTNTSKASRVPDLSKKGWLFSGTHRYNGLSSVFREAASKRSFTRQVASFSFLSKCALDKATLDLVVSKENEKRNKPANLGLTSSNGHGSCHPQLFFPQFPGCWESTTELSESE